MTEHTGPYWRTLTLDNETLLALPLPGGTGKPLNLRGIHQPGSRGWLWNGKSLEPWIPRGLAEAEGVPLYTGPALEGESLLHLLETRRFNREHLLLLARALPDLYRRAGNDPSPELRVTGLSPLGTFFTRTGGILFLSDGLISRLVPMSGTGGNLWETRLRFPGLSGGRNLLFSWGVLAYTALAGTPPFAPEAEEEEELRSRMSRGVFVPLEGVNREPSPELCGEINRCLTPLLLPEGTVSPWEAWVRLADNPGEAVLPSQEERERLFRQGEKTGRKRESAHLRRRFFRKWGVLLAGGAVAAGFVISLAVSILRGVFAPPLTLGMEPRQVLETYFDGINRLDSETVEGCAYKKAAKDRVNRVINLYAVSRIRMGYEGSSPYITASEWLARPGRTLEEREAVYGITDLVLTRLAEDRFRADYREWVTGATEETQDSMNPVKQVQGYQVSEEYRLVWKKEAWLIGEILPLESRELPPGE